MKVFVGFGYNERDSWIEQQVFPLLLSLDFIVVHGQEVQGQDIPGAVKQKIEQSDAVIGFFTIRAGQEHAEFSSHTWVMQEMVYAVAKHKPIIPIKETGVNVPNGLLGNPQYIKLRQDDRLACVVELVRALNRRNIRRLKLDPGDGLLRKHIHQWRHRDTFSIKYRSQENGEESAWESGRLEVVNQAFYLNVSDVPKRAMVEVEGYLDGARRFSSGWVSADAVQVEIAGA